MKNVLVAEDNAGQAKAIRCSLSAAGLEVLSARNGYAALELAESQQFDLIITDYNMPKLNGSDFCRRLRQNPRYMHIPIVLMTACTDDLNLDRLSNDLRLTEIWAKPLSLSSLVDRVNAILVTQGMPITPTYSRAGLHTTKHAP